jgi:hypothetical protein
MRARDNPFASARLHQLRYRLRGATWEDILARLEQLDWRAAVVGPHGSGKTTFLETLAPRLRARGFQIRLVRLSEDHPCFAPDQLEPVFAGQDQRPLVMLDGAEQLGAWAWRRFLRRTRQAHGLLITTHQPGRLPTLWRCKTTPDLLAALVEELQPRSVAPVGMLFDRHAGNLRGALRELYDWQAAR